MKRILSFVIIFALLVPFAACSKAPEKEANDPPAPTDTATERPADPTEEPVIPTAAPTDEPAEELPEVFVGDDVFFILYPDGSLYGWGNNEHGQVGCGAAGTVGVPVHIADGLTPVYIGETVFALDGEGTLWGWGRNDGADLGLGDTVDRTKPEKILEGVTKIARYYNGGWFALTGDGKLYNWGFDAWDDDLTEEERTASSVPSLYYENVKSFDEDYIITVGGDLIERWGDFRKIAENVSEAYGFDGWTALYKGVDGTLYEWRKVWDSDETVTIAVCEGIRTVIGGYILTEDGTVLDYDHPFIRDQETDTTLIKVLDGVKELVHAEAYSEAFDCFDVTFALKENGELWAWESADGIGSGRTDDENRSVPALVAEGVRSVYTNGLQTYVILENGDVYATGMNNAESGSLGTAGDTDGDVIGYFVKLGIENAAYFATRATTDLRYATDAWDEYESWTEGLTVYTRSFAVLHDGTVLAWGYNGDGFLAGDTADAVIHTPTEIRPEGR
ncbi:MAG: hypothetical protein J5854_06330 [Clostridia bacterium]|nr:hypothetical protein [Clostridia bacterium]